MFGMMEAMLGFLRRQVGLRTDTADPAGSLHAKVGHVDSQVDNIIANINQGIYHREVTPSNNIKFSSDAEVYAGSSTYTLYKQIAINTFGKVRISFDLCSGPEHTSPRTGYGRIYRNGSPYGTERATNSATYVTFTEDLLFGPGDVIELYVCRQGDSDTYARARNFRVSFDFVSSANGGVVLM